MSHFEKVVNCSWLASHSHQGINSDAVSTACTALGEGTLKPSSVKTRLILFNTISDGSKTLSVALTLAKRRRFKNNLTA